MQFCITVVVFDEKMLTKWFLYFNETWNHSSKSKQAKNSQIFRISKLYCNVFKILKQF